MPKVGDRIMLVPESWPAPGYDAGYIGDVVVNGRQIGPGDTSLIEKLLPPRWFTHKSMEIAEVRTVPGRNGTVYIVDQTITITLKLKLLEREFEVVDEQGE